MNLPALLNRHFQGSIFCCCPRTLWEGWMGDVNGNVYFLSVCLSARSLPSPGRCSVAARVWIFLRCGTDAILSAVQNAIIPPYSLGAKPQAHALFSATGHCRRVWVVTGIHSLGEDGLRAKRLVRKSPCKPLPVCKDQGTWKWTASELIAGLLRYKWEQD